jgi:para-aminobenzoate synthetase/4-amino-4-deoxychorismate lyase
MVSGGFVSKIGEGAPVQLDRARFDLIETMRFTPEEGIPLLELHLERLRESTQVLGFAYDRHALRNAIQALCFDAERPSKLRLIAARSGAFSLELTDVPTELPQPVICGVLPLPVDSDDWRLRHKTTERGFYERGLAVAQAAGAHEALFLRDDGLVTEGCFTNLFVERDGVLLTPPAALGLLPGVLRHSLIEAGRAREARLTLDDLAGGFLVGNALRGLMPADLLT